MRRGQTEAGALADRLCRPQRVGVFGYRGVGKTTLLAMLYREAVGGRLPGLRLAAADATTATYLSEKILQLEAGQPVPGTLAETELRFHLYRGNVALDLLFKDYQGEHVELGRDEPIRAFLRDCDAVWLCLDTATLAADGERLRRQQEVEQLIEDCLAAEPGRTMERPVALVLTKADVREAADAGVAAEPLDMVRHALATHCPRSTVLEVSSLGRPLAGGPADDLRPQGLDGPLTWLAEALQAQDEARMERLGRLTADVATWERATRCFIRRYPDAPAGTLYRKRLAVMKRQRRRRLGLAGAAAAVSLLLGATTYDTVGRRRAARVEAESAEPAAAVRAWQSYQAWHPTRSWLRPGAARAEDDHLRDLEEQARAQERAERLAALTRQAADPDGDPAADWQEFARFRAAYPEVPSAELDTVRAALAARRDAQAAGRARQAFAELEAAARRTGDLPTLVIQADQFLHDYPDSAPASEVRRRRADYLRRIDERDIEAARDYSARNPLHFQARRAHYQRYLDQHPAGGAFTREAEAALDRIAGEWDRHDFRAVRDHFTANPGDVAGLVDRCRAYLAAHPQGRFAAAAGDLLRWTDRVTAPGEYRVVLRSGAFDKDVARFFSRGPKLSVELEVAGVRYGPSTIVYNRYDPEWDFEFPRRVRWKLGDPVRVIVTEHSWKDRVVFDVASPENDVLGMRLLAGELWQGTNRVTFESDFAVPALPAVE